MFLLVVIISKLVFQFAIEGKKTLCPEEVCRSNLKGEADS